MRRHRLCLLIVLGVVGVVLAATILSSSFTHEVNQDLYKGHSNSGKNLYESHLNSGKKKAEWNTSAPLSAKLIVFYTNVYGERIHIQKHLRQDCEYSCRWSVQRADYEHADAVVFHLYNNLNSKDFIMSHLPKRRSPRQKWVLMVKEPQAFFFSDQLRQLNNMFNLTMTFQSDSDVSIPQGRFVRLPVDEAKELAKKGVNHWKNRKKLVAWMVSNCVTSSKREDFIKELQKYIDVDVYGECGNLGNGPKNWSRDKYRQTLAAEYKFYLALENSDCDDYITEKFWRNLDLGMIPIVRGQRALYKQIAPPNSYIHADSFITAENLAKYLKEVDANSTLLDQYHEWRMTFRVNFKPFSCNERWTCELCERVHNSAPKTVDIYKHFSEDTRCFSYHNLKDSNHRGERIQNLNRE